MRTRACCTMPFQHRGYWGRDADNDIMNPKTFVANPLNVVALGWALSATLLVLFVICLIVALVLPDWQASHVWVALFSAAPLSSIRVWVDGIVFSIVFGWIGGVVFGFVYNRVIAR